MELKEGYGHSFFGVLAAFRTGWVHFYTTLGIDLNYGSILGPHSGIFFVSYSA